MKKDKMCQRDRGKDICLANWQNWLKSFIIHILLSSINITFSPARFDLSYVFSARKWLSKKLSLILLRRKHNLCSSPEIPVKPARYYRLTLRTRPAFLTNCLVNWPKPTILYVDSFLQVHLLRGQFQGTLNFRPHPGRYLRKKHRQSEDDTPQD